MGVHYNVLLVANLENNMRTNKHLIKGFIMKKSLLKVSVGLLALTALSSCMMHGHDNRMTKSGMNMEQCMMMNGKMRREMMMNGMMKRNMMVSDCMMQDNSMNNGMKKGMKKGSMMQMQDNNQVNNMMNNNQMNNQQ